MRPHYLSALFAPESVAMFGASETQNSVGKVVFKNLLEGGFEGDIYAINPKRETVQGQKAYPDLDSIGEDIDLAIVATPAHTVPAIVEQCGVYGIKSMIILSAGFREIGEQGWALEDKVRDAARTYGIRFIGPNCLGLIRPSIGLNATFGNNSASEGGIALVSQSGALCTSILDWAENRDVGFSAVVSTGIAADLDFGDILDYLASDPKTESIILYIEGLKDSRRFMSGLRAAARIKPVIAIKAGVNPKGLPLRCLIPARWSAATKHSPRHSTDPVWCGWTRSARCLPPRAPCRRSTSPPVIGWPLSPTPAALLFWRPTAPPRSTSTLPS